MAQYDAVARHYRNRIAPKYEPIADLVVTRASPPDGATVVEVATGTGALTRLLAPKVLTTGRYVATDVSAAMLTIARDDVDAPVDFVVADAARLPFADASSHLVVSSLGPIQESADYFAEVCRVLRPGGRLVLTMWGWGYAEALLLQQVRTALGLGDYPTTPAADAAPRAAAAGFADVSFEEVRLEVRHASVDAYIDYRAAFGCPPWLPPERYEEVLTGLRQHVAPYVDDSGVVNLDWTILVLSATRPGSPY